MPLDLSDLLAERRELDVKYHDFVICITYNPNTQTEVIEELMKEQIDEQRYAASLRTFIVKSVTKWDLTEDGKPLPIDDETVRTKVPTAVQVAITTAITEDIRGPEASGSFVVR